MKTGFRWWLKQQVERLESEIRTHPVFESEEKPTNEELMELRRLAVVHRYLATQLERLPIKSRAVMPRNRGNRQEIDLREYVSV